MLGTVLLAALACASGSGRGFYHEVKPGENLYRIGLRYGVPSQTLAKANHIDDVHSVAVGTELWIPSPSHLPATEIGRAHV